jgi:hypothetical protein
VTSRSFSNVGSRGNTQVRIRPYGSKPRALAVVDESEDEDEDESASTRCHAAESAASRAAMHAGCSKAAADAGPAQAAVNDIRNEAPLRPQSPQVGACSSDLLHFRTRRSPTTGGGCTVLGWLTVLCALVCHLGWLHCHWLAHRVVHTRLLLVALPRSRFGLVLNLLGRIWMSRPKAVPSYVCANYFMQN